MERSEGRRRLLVTAGIVAPDHPLLVRAREDGVEALFPEQPIDRSEAASIERVRGIHGAVVGAEPYTERVIAASALKVISRTGVGYDAIDVEAATAHGVVVCTAPGANAEAVADHAFGLILALARRILPLDQGLRARDWRRPGSIDVYGQTLGILGLGRIGKRVARRARGFSMRIVAHDPVWDEEFAAEHGVERLSLEDVVREADFLTLHLPSTAETRHVVDARRLALMKPTAFLINAARGALVDEAALYDALRDGRIAGAGLDVFEREPLGASPLLELENVVLTPHSAYYSPKSNAATVQMALENALLVLAGQRPLFCVNPEVFGEKE